MEEKESKGLNIFIKILIVIAVLFILFTIMINALYTFYDKKVSKIVPSNVESYRILDEIEEYCEREKSGLAQNKEKLCDSNMTQEDIAKIVDLGDIEIIEASYVNNKLVRLKLKIQDKQIFDLQNGEMIKVD